MPMLRAFPLKMLACAWLAQLAWLPMARAGAIPVATLSFHEIKLTHDNGKVFAIGFMPFDTGKLYWAVDQGGAASLYTHALDSDTVVELNGVIPSGFVPSGFTWSPDGRQAAMARGPVLKLVGIGVRATHSLFMGTAQWGPMFWTPNRSILTACSPDPKVARKLCVVGTSTGLVTVLPAPGDGSMYAVGYIEGANKLIYERWDPGAGSNPMHLYSASIFSDHVGNLMPLSYPDIQGEGYLTVTPDGAYGVTLGRASQAKQDTSDVYLGDFSTDEWLRVPSPAASEQVSQAVLSPDHKRLVLVTSDSKGSYRLWLADVPDKLLGSTGTPH
jgi:WD40 repeat protein